MFTTKKLIAFACTAVLGLGAAQAAGAPDPGSERSERTKAVERATGVAPMQRPTERLRHAVDVHRARVGYRQARAGARAAGVVAKLEPDLLERHRVGPDELRDAAVRLDEMAERREESAEPVADEGSSLVSPESLGVSQETLDSIAACESGGDPTAVSADGTYRGKYQFDVSTWASIGGSGDPAAAPEAEQDLRAAMLYAQAGTSPWPICGG